MKTTALVSALTLLAILAPSALGQTSTWNTGSGDWSVGGNWTGGVPTSTSNVVIGPSSGPFSFGSPTLDVSTTVNTLNLGMEASLTFGFASSLTVNGTATLVGNTNVDLSSLTLNGASENFGTINLSTETITFKGRTFTLGEGFVNGTGTLNNAGTIQGAGNLSVAIFNLGTIQGTGSNPLILSGSVTNAGSIQNVALDGGTVNGGILEGNFSSNGGTISAAQLGAPTTITQPGSSFFLAAGSTLSLKGTAENFGGVTLGNGSTVNGGGTATLVTSGINSPEIFILPVSGNGATLAAMNVNNANGTLIGDGMGLTLNNVSVSGGTLNGQFTTLNGTTVTNGQLGEALGAFSLTDGSTLGIQGKVTTGGAVTLGNATLTGSNTGTLTNFTTITGNGATLTGLSVNNVGTITGTGAGITLNGVSLDGGGLGNGVLNGLFIPINGTTIANSELGSAGGSFTVPDGSTVALRGEILIGNSLSLGSGTTLNGGGATTLLNLSGSPITGIGATLIGMNINDSSATATLTGIGAGLTLNGVGVTGGFLSGQFTTLNGTSITNATLDSFNLTAGSTLALEGAITQNGSFTNAGTLLIDKGATLNNPGTTSYVQTAGHTIVDGTIGVGSPAVQLQGGVLSGTGAVNSGLVNVAGIVQPGDAGAPGTLFVNGYEQEAGALFDELIGASGNGEVFAGAGSIKLDPGALLDIDLLSGFKPSDGEMFAIMEGTNLSGTFVNAPTTGFEMAGWNWMIAYNQFDIVLDAVSPVNGGGGGTTTTPEPASTFLLVMGLGAIALWNLRIRKTARADAAQRTKLG